MPSKLRRPARAKALVRAYMNGKKAYDERQRRRILRLRQARQRARQELGHIENSSSGSLTPFSDPSPLSGDSEGSNMSEDSLSDMDVDMESLPSLDDDSNSNTGSTESSGELTDSTSSSDSSATDMFNLDSDADDEYSSDSSDGGSSDDEVEDYNLTNPWTRARKAVVQELNEMYAKRYEESRNNLPRGPSYLHHVLVALKNTREDHFRQQLRVNPSTFDAIVRRIEDDPVFANQSSNSQMSVEDQLAITLYRFGRSGNASGLQDVANWAGVAKGTVSLVTKRVMTAILRPEFMSQAVRFPDEDEKREAKEWVRQHSCHVWRHGWCFVDGTLVPLAARPAWFGESYWDRKDRYSMNVQVR